MKSLIKILQESVPEVNFESNNALISGGALDSLDVVNIISDISDAYNIEIPVEDIIPENFDSISSIQKLIDRIRD